MMLRVASGSVASSSTWSADFTPMLALAECSASITPLMRAFRSARVTDGFMAAASTAVGSTL